MRYAIDERRAEPRNSVHLWAVVQRQGAADAIKVVLVNLSGVGFKMRSAEGFSVGEFVHLELASGLVAEGRIMRRGDEPFDYGCRFSHPLPPAVVHRVLGRTAGMSQSNVDQHLLKLRREIQPSSFA